MPILIISDIHGSSNRLKDVLSTPLEYDMIVLVGDLLYHGPRNPILDDYNPQGVADILNSLQVPIVAVRGNCDAEVDQMLLDIQIMQDYAVFPYESTSIYLTHGHLVDPLTYAPTTGCNLFISGHTHVPIMQRIENTVVYNPGSISLPKEGHPNSYGYFDGKTLKTYTLKHEVYMDLSL